MPRLFFRTIVLLVLGAMLNFITAAAIAVWSSGNDWKNTAATVKTEVRVSAPLPDSFAHWRDAPPSRSFHWTCGVLGGDMLEFDEPGGYGFHHGIVISPGLSSDPIGGVFGMSLRSGWPLHAFEGVHWTAIGDVSVGLPMQVIFEAAIPASRLRFSPPQDSITRSFGDRLIPLRPILPGLVINTLLYAGMLWLMFLAPGIIRRRLRIRRGLCSKCGYNLKSSGIAHDRCPECGALVHSPSV